MTEMGILAPAIPITHLFISIIIYALALNARRKRPMWLIPLFFFQSLALMTADHWPSTGVDSLWGLLICIWISHSISVLFLEDRGLIEDDNLSARTQLWYWKAWRTWNNPRLLGTSREERCTPKAFLGHRSRVTFTIIRFSKVVAYGILSIYIQPLLIPGAFMPLQATDFDQIRQTYFRRVLSEHHPVTVRETAMRALFAVFWAWGAFVMVDGAHSALSVVFVSILRFDQPHEWPPIFGNLRNARSLRQFWGQFWHRLVVLPYINYGKAIARVVFRCRPGSKLYKLLIAFVVFFISGLAHAVVAWQLGDRCGWYLDIWWFSLNFAASAAEGEVLSRLLQPRVEPLYFQEGGFLSCLDPRLGYLWVFMFFFWSVPKWQYPKVHCLFTDIEEAARHAGE